MESDDTVRWDDLSEEEKTKAIDLIDKFNEMFEQHVQEGAKPCENSTLKD